MTTITKQPSLINEHAHYPSKQALSQFIQTFETPKFRRAIRPGFLARTDGLPVDETIADLEERAAADPQFAGLLSRMLSVSDLSPKLYDRFRDNPNSLYNWLPAVEKALDVSKTTLKSPKTKTWRLPIELAQFIRMEYSDTTKHDRDLFNQLVFDQFDLEDGKTYFIKTGTFSSKFQFANAKCSEPREMGEYFQVINNFAMMVGAGQSIDLVVREYIEDVENNPTIYNGMPLRTEFRVFVDCDEDKIIGVVPYWHPIVMKRALQSDMVDSILPDLETYKLHEDKLTSEYNKYLAQVKNEVSDLLPNLELTGQFSIDVMKNGEDFYVLDLALMKDSALKELV